MVSRRHWGVLGVGQVATWNCGFGVRCHSANASICWHGPSLPVVEERACRNPIQPHIAIVLLPTFVPYLLGVFGVGFQASLALPVHAGCS